jgi:two-component system response regulator EvgA
MGSSFMGEMKLRVLLADDHPKWLAMLVSIVGAECEVVATAVDGKSALQAISHFNPDVAVLDIGMPRLNGLDVTRELMKNGRRPAVVICSAHAMPELVEAAREAGASGFVCKQRCAQDLLPAVEAAGRGRLSFPPVCEGLLKAG